MTQYATPTTVTGTGWTGSASDLGDSSDLTFLQSPANPVTADSVDVTLGAVTDPGCTHDHVVRVRAATALAPAADHAVTVEVRNADDDSLVAEFDTADLSMTPASTTYTLTAAQAAALHGYGAGATKFRVRRAAAQGVGTVAGIASVTAVGSMAGEGTSVAFVWDAFGVGTTSYLLQVGTASGTWDQHDADVGNVLSHSVTLAPGTYYARVYAQPSGTLSPNGEQTVTVS